jgi:hypothetical protein
MNATRALWARTNVRLWPETYRLVSLPKDRWAEALAWYATQADAFAAVVRERDEVSLTVEQGAWAASPLQPAAFNVSEPQRVLTFDLELELSVVGYIAPAAARLAAAGISIVPQCAFLRDHVLVRDDDATRALSVLQDFIAECRTGA